MNSATAHAIKKLSTPKPHRGTKPRIAGTGSASLRRLKEIVARTNGMASQKLDRAAWDYYEPIRVHEFSRALNRQW